MEFDDTIVANSSEMPVGALVCGWYKVSLEPNETREWIVEVSPVKFTENFRGSLERNASWCSFLGGTVWGRCKVSLGDAVWEMERTVGAAICKRVGNDWYKRWPCGRHLRWKLGRR